MRAGVSETERSRRDARTTAVSSARDAEELLDPAHQVGSCGPRCCRARTSASSACSVASFAACRSASICASISASCRARAQDRVEPVACRADSTAHRRRATTVGDARLPEQQAHFAEIRRRLQRGELAARSARILADDLDLPLRKQVQRIGRLARAKHDLVRHVSARRRASARALRVPRRSTTRTGPSCRARRCDGRFRAAPSPAARRAALRRRGAGTGCPAPGASAPHRRARGRANRRPSNARHPSGRRRPHIRRRCP